MACREGTTADGFETQFGTNHLGHFVLVNRIAALMKAGSRLVNLSSAGHRFADMDLEDPNFERMPYAEFVAYGRSKTANILFAVEFDPRHKADGVRAASVHPGVIQTELSRHMKPEDLQQMMERMNEAACAQAAPPPAIKPFRKARRPPRLGRGGRARRRGWRALLRGLPRGRTYRWTRHTLRRTSLCARSRPRQSALGQE
jgi:NAD(P)-dependent dehydrogenase (short-subunit alcohol dehydrogenase family)